MKRLNLVKIIYLDIKNNAFSLEKKSNKFFGILLTLIFLIIAFYPKTINTNIKFYFIFFAFVNLIISLIKPNIFAIFNYLFIKFGIILDTKNKNYSGIDLLKIKRSKIPAVTHVDYSARIQTVHYDTNPLYYRLIKKFYEITGVPILINTSFNIRGEPIVCNVEDAYNCFMGTDLDMLVCNSFVLKKNQQNSNKVHDYKNKFQLD